MSYRFRRAFLFLVVGACGGEPEPVVTQRAAPIDTPGAASVAFTRGRGAESILLSTRPGAGIAEYTLDNSWHTSWQAITEITGFKWKGPKLVSSGDYRAVAATYDAGADRLSVLARRGDELVELAREGDRWTDPLTIATGVAGTPSILEGSHDGNLEAVTPLAAGGLMHLFRSSRDRAWSETSRFGSGPVDAVTMVQDAASAHLDVIALVGAELAHYWRDDLGTWE